MTDRKRLDRHLDPGAAGEGLNRGASALEVVADGGIERAGVDLRPVLDLKLRAQNT